MCCCGKPTVNGQPGYRWNEPNGPTSIREPNPPDMEEGDLLLYDEPGRCGGLDAHSHHFRIVQRSGSLYLLVRHGGGDERMRLLCLKRLPALFASMDSDTRYWILHTIYSAHSDGADKARDRERALWRKAAADKRIRTRKMPKSDYVKVWIEMAAA